MFIKIVNDLILDKINGDIELVVEDSIDSITIKGEKRYFYKVYWYKKREDINSSSIEEQFKLLAKHIKNCNDVKELENINEKIKNINYILESKIKIINSLESII